MKYLYKKILLFTLLIISACQREIPIEGTFDFEGEKIVVNAVLTPSEIINVHISRSTSPFVSTLTPDYNLSGANVELYKNGSFVEQMTYWQDGVYISPSDLLPQPNENYHFKVSHNDLETVETLPEEVPNPISLFDYYISEQNEQLTVHFSINDNPNKQNVYSIDIVGVTPETSRLGVGAGNLVNDDGTNCLFLYEEGEVFTDDCFLGNSTADFSVLLDKNRAYLIEREANIGITLKHLSATYDEYLSNQNDYYNYVPGFSDPPPLFSNVIGGYGAVLSYTVDEVVVEL